MPNKCEACSDGYIARPESSVEELKLCFFCARILRDSQRSPEHLQRLLDYVTIGAGASIAEVA